jgi:site-specific DNA-methyltransferase (adenine-specific)
MKQKKTTPIIFHNSRFFNEDCITGAQQNIDDNSVDLIITDPPYGINGDNLHLHYNRNESLVVDGYVEVPQSKYEQFSLDWIKEAERILKPGGAIYIISGYTNLYYILHALRETKLKEVNHIIWKYNFGVFTKKKFVSSHYHILYYEKPGGSRIFNVESRFGLQEEFETGRSKNYCDREDVWIIPRQYKPRKIKNKNELPDELLIKILQYSSEEGDLVSDFFLGGFSTARVAIGLNRNIIGFEISPAIFKQKIGEIQDIEPGQLLHYLHNPIINNPENQGKTWPRNECEKLIERFNELTSEGKFKKEILKILQEEFKRGYWSIDKALKKGRKE